MAHCKFFLNHPRKESEMQNQQQAQLFAFQLAQKQQEETTPAPQWKAREGISVAGCSGPNAYDNYRAASTWGVADAGIYC
jgi:hypothetical protein